MILILTKSVIDSDTDSKLPLSRLQSSKCVPGKSQFSNLKLFLKPFLLKIKICFGHKMLLNLFHEMETRKVVALKQPW